MQAVTDISEKREKKVINTAQPVRHLDVLKAHPDNPREEIARDDPKIVEMSHSIEKHGVIEPLVITPENQIIAGHRRSVAARLAAERSGRDDLFYVPVTVRAVEPAAVLEIMLQENMQRESLTPVEEARAMYAIMERKHLTVADLARTVAVPVAQCRERLAILKLEPEVQQLYAANELPLSVATLLAQVKLAEEQLNYAGMLVRRTLTTPKLKEILKAGKKNGKELADKNNAETVADIPRPRVAEGQHAPLDRSEAVAALEKVLGKRISLHTFRNVLETVCCACGMQKHADICLSCPLPRLVMGVVGRAE